jgi:hypothetical protein
MADLYKHTQAKAIAPFTTDKCAINWGGPVFAANQVSVSYTQQVQRRRTIGNKNVMLWANLPSGQITIARMMGDNSKEIYSKNGWNMCTPTDITLETKGCNESVIFTAKDCLVVNYQIQLETEGLTVIDNLTIEFLELFQG